MSDYYKRLAVREGWERYVKRATTYLRSARDILHGEYDGMRPISTIPTDYWYLLDMTLEASIEIVDALPDSFFQEEEVEDFFGLGGERRTMNMSDDVYEAAKKLMALVERRRGGGKLLTLIEKLEATEGRTPEEAEAFRAHAEKLRERLKGGGG